MMKESPHKYPRQGMPPAETHMSGKLSFLAHLTHSDKMSFSDLSSSVARRQSVNNGLR